MQRVESNVSIENCSICLEKMDESSMQSKTIAILHPRKGNQAAEPHVFHSVCINEWFQKNRSCPLCREPISAPQPTEFKWRWDWYKEINLEEVMPDLSRVCFNFSFHVWH